MAYSVSQLTLQSSPLEVINYAIGRPLIVDISVQLNVRQYWYTGKRGRDGNIRKPIFDYFLRFNGSNIQSLIRFSDNFSTNSAPVPETYNVQTYRHQIPAGTKGNYTVYIALQNYLDRDISWTNFVEININFIRATAVGFV